MRLKILIMVMVLTFLECTNSPVLLPETSLPAQKNFTLSQADSLWKLRADSSNAARALKAYRALSRQDTTSIILWSKLSRAYYYYAQYIQVEQGDRDSLYMEGYKASQAILNREPQYYELLFSTGDENMAIRGLGQEYIDALYWGMANYGQWLSTKGPLVRLGQREIVWTTLDHIHDLDSTYYHGAYYRYRGALLCRDPKTQADTVLIRSSFDKARSIAPDYLGNNTLMAAFYCPLVGDKKLFYELLTAVVTATINPNSAYAPENKWEKRIAERLMIRAEKENWFSP